jgi:hypothetical protein
MATNTRVAAVGQVHHPSALRNRVPILKTMLSIIPDNTTGKGIEIASGTGALLELISPGYPSIMWQPTEYVPEEKVDPEEQWSKHGKIGLRQVTDELRNIDYHGSEVFKNCEPAIGLDLMKVSKPNFLCHNRSALPNEMS